MAVQVIYSDIAENFAQNPFSKDVAASINDQSVKDSVLSLLLTNKYERLYQPDVGSDIPALLFENVGPLTSYQIERNILITLSSLEPRVRVTDVSVIDDSDRNHYEVTIQFTILADTTKNQTLVFTLSAQQG